MTVVLPVMPDACDVLRRVLLAAGFARVSTRDPSDVSTPWIRLDLSGGSTVARQGLWAPRVDVHCFASTPTAASLLARQAHTALLAATNEWTTAGHLAGCDTAVAAQNLPDQTRTPPMERHVFSVTAYIRP